MATILDLRDLPSGSRIFVDTMIFVYHYSSLSISCSSFLLRVINRDVVAYVDASILADLLHKLMMKEANDKSFITSASHKKLKAHLANHPAGAVLLTECQSTLEQTIAMGVTVEAVTGRLVKDTSSERQNNALMTNDSLHLGIMNRISPKITNLATFDGDYDNIPGITIWKPTDMKKRIENSQVAGN